MNTFIDPLIIPDIDECNEHTSGCEQVCNNTVGSYQCLCQDDYILNTDKSCSMGKAFCSSSSSSSSSYVLYNITCIHLVIYIYIFACESM